MFCLPLAENYVEKVINMAVFKVKHKANPQFGEPMGKYKDDKANVSAYAMNQVKTPHDYVGGININDLSHAAEEMTAVARYFGKESGVRLRHMILSFEAEERVSAYQAYFLAYQVAAYYGGEYQILFAVHEDGAAPHIHFVMNMVSLATGLKYRGRRQDYYDFQAHMRRVLWEYAGIKMVMAVKDK